MSISDPLNHLGSIWYHSEALEVLYSPNHFLGLDFFCSFLQQTGSKKRNACIIKIASDCQACGPRVQLNTYTDKRVPIHYLLVNMTWGNFNYDKFCFLETDFLIELRSKKLLNCTVVGHFFATHSVRSSSPSIRTNKREEAETAEGVKT